MGWPAMDGTPRTAGYRRPGWRPLWKPRWWPDWGPALLPLLLLLPFYLPLAGRWFTSEDFLLLRVLRQQPPWQDPAALLAGPWLGIEVVRFYRPLATVLLAVEAKLFAARPWGYNLLHLGVHALSVALVYRIARLLAPPRRQLPARSYGHSGAAPEERAGQVAALAAASLFALHPLHPNAVAWIASFATLYAGPFFLGCVALWLAWRRDGGAARWVGAFVLFLAALGCYEAALVLPVLLAAGELLLPRPPAPSRRRRALALLPFLAAAAGYLLLRRAIFGDAVGGYGAFAERLAPSAVGRLAADALLCLYRLLHPSYAAPAPAWASLAVAAWLLLPLLFLALVARRRAAAKAQGAGPPPTGSGLPSAGGLLGVWFFGWLWAVLAFAPFAFQPFVPANGRYAYLAAAGLALALGRLAAAAVGGGRAAAVAALAVGLLAAWWMALLAGSVGDHRRAGELSRRVTADLAAALAAAPAAADAPPAPVFVVAPPLFLRNAAGVPVAQVLRYGLSDSQQPPFAEPAAATAVYPLPPSRPADLAPLAAALPAARFYLWDAEAGELRSIRPLVARQQARRRSGAGALAPLAVAGPGEPPPVSPTAPAPSPTPLPVDRVAWVTPAEVAPAAAVRLRLVVASEGNPLLLDLPPAAAEGEVRSVELPMDYVRSMRRLYGSPIWWWIEARGEGRLQAASRPRTLP